MSSGLFWALDGDGDIKKRGESVKRTGRKDPQPRIRPPIPVTDWVRPSEFPSLAAAKTIAFDIETKDPQLKEKGPGVRRDGHIVGIAVAVDGWHGYFPMRHEESSLNFDPSQVLDWCRRELTRDGQLKVGANVSYDLDYLAQAGVDVRGPFYDTHVAEPLIDENSASYSLDAQSMKYLGHRKVLAAVEAWGEEAFGAGRARANIYRTPPELIGPMAEGDVTIPLEIMVHQRKVLAAEGLERVFEVESKLIPMLVAMRRRGVRIDVDGTQQLSERLKRNKTAALKAIHQLTGYTPDLWSAESIASMFKKLDIPVPLTAKTRKPSITQGWLESQDHPAATFLLKARQYDKFDNTFLQGHLLSNLIDGRVHCQFHQLPTGENGAVSGRFSASNPNLQNIPTRDKVLGPLLRALFLPDEGEQWGALDWSQVEYRLLVHFAALMKLSGVADAVMAYRNDYKTDFHQMVAELTGLSRTDAKNFNFGMVYGQGIELIAATLEISLEEAKVLSDIYHSRAPYIRELSRNAQNKVKSRGYLKTVLGRRRRFPVFEDNDGKRYDEDGDGRRRSFTHKALNGLIQGSAADVMKMAMVQMYESGVMLDLGVPLLTVHDELALSVPDNQQSREAFEEVRNIMQTCIRLEIPLLADGGLGANWAAAKAT